MRISYCDDEDIPGQVALWNANCQRSMQGRKGQAALRELEAALLALPEPRLAHGGLVVGDDFCAVGAMIRHRHGVERVKAIKAQRYTDAWGDEEDCAEDTDELATAELGVPKMVAWKIVELNDVVLDPQYAHGFLKRATPLTPEQRYTEVLAWVRSQLKG